MIAKDKILDLINDMIEIKEVFVVSLDVSPTNKITLLIDHMNGINIKNCIEFSRVIESNLDRDQEDYELEVSSPGLGSPFLVANQYRKNIGREVEVLQKDGISKKGILILADDNTFAIEEEKKIRIAGQKKKQLFKERTDYSYHDINTVKAVVKI